MNKVLDRLGNPAEVGQRVAYAFYGKNLDIGVIVKINPVTVTIRDGWWFRKTKKEQDEYKWPKHSLSIKKPEHFIILDEFTE